MHRFFIRIFTRLIFLLAMNTVSPASTNFNNNKLFAPRQQNTFLNVLESLSANESAQIKAVMNKGLTCPDSAFNVSFGGALGWTINALDQDPLPCYLLLLRKEFFSEYGTNKLALSNVYGSTLHNISVLTKLRETVKNHREQTTSHDLDEMAKNLATELQSCENFKAQIEKNLATVGILPTSLFPKNPRIIFMFKHLQQRCQVYRPKAISFDAFKTSGNQELQRLARKDMAADYALLTIQHKICSAYKELEPNFKFLDEQSITDALKSMHKELTEFGIHVAVSSQVNPGPGPNQSKTSHQSQQLTFTVGTTWPEPVFFLPNEGSPIPPEFFSPRSTIPMPFP